MARIKRKISRNPLFTRRNGETEDGGVLMREGISIPYSIRYSNRSTRLSIRILPDRSVQAVSPLNISRDLITGFVTKNEEWIFRHLLSDAHARAAEHTYIDGEQFLFLGKNLRLCIEHDADKPDVFRRDEQIILRLPHQISGPEPVIIRRLLEFFYKRELYSLVLPMADHYKAIIGVSVPQIKIHNQKTKWGSCTAKSLIFNLRLCMAPREIIEYVVVHEICHLRQRNHSPAFWHEVEMILPDYKTREKYLKQNGPQYLLNE